MPRRPSRPGLLASPCIGGPGPNLGPDRPSVESATREQLLNRAVRKVLSLSMLVDSGKFALGNVQDMQKCNFSVTSFSAMPTRWSMRGPFR